MCCVVQHSSPAKSMLLLSNCVVILMIPGRASCAFTYENVLIVIAALCTCPYFLFFCRYVSQFTTSYRDPTSTC